MKRLIASFVGLGLIAAPALATTTQAPTAKTAKAQKKSAKLAKKNAAHAAAASTPKSN
jgi:hypothetical protein